MHPKRPNERDLIIGRLADRQHGVVTREQLLAAALGSDVIKGALRATRLRPLFSGVYAVGHTALRREGWWMAALLACGDGAALSHRAAAMLWDLRTGLILPIDVTITSDRGRKRKGIEPHRGLLHPTDTLIRDGLRVTTPARTIVDLAATSSGRLMRETIERAQDRSRFRPDEIRAICERGRRPPGTGQLLHLLALLGPDRDNARSHLERLFLMATRKNRLPRPLVNHPIAGRKRDFVWPDQRLVIETDGYRYHSSRTAQRRDRKRDRELTALNWRPARFTYEEIAFEPDAVAAELATLLTSRRER